MGLVQLWRDATRPYPSRTRALARATLLLTAVCAGALLALVVISTSDVP